MGAGVPQVSILRPGIPQNTARVVHQQAPFLHSAHRRNSHPCSTLPVTGMPRILSQFRKALLLALDHDMFGVAKGAAYSGMLFSFPTVVVLTTVLAQVPEGTTMVGEMRTSLNQFLPAGSLDPLQSALETNHYYSTKVLLSATSLSVFAGLGLMLSLMEGFRRAYELPSGDWSYQQRVLRAFMLVPIVLVPLW